MSIYQKVILQNLKRYRYEFDPDLILDKLKSPSSLESLTTNEIELNGAQLTNRLPRSLRLVDSLNHYIYTPDHVWHPLCSTFENPINKYDTWTVYMRGYDDP